jgi:uncharacterized repeat protein (TIGR03803 family)
VLHASDGALYGTAAGGGAFGNGTIFKIQKDGSGFETLYELGESGGGRLDGSFPFAELIQGRDGALYGTAFHGGANNGGVIFRIATDGTGYARLRDLWGGTGLAGGLLQGPDGGLYGMTQAGGPALGSAYRIEEDGSGFVEAGLGPLDGATPMGTPVFGPGGLLFGVTQGDNGTVFSVDPGSGTIATVHRFAQQSFVTRAAGPILGSDGALYGTTTLGGPRGGGVVFRLVPVGGD